MYYSIIVRNLDYKHEVHKIAGEDFYPVELSCSTGYLIQDAQMKAREIVEAAGDADLNLEVTVVQVTRISF